MGSAPVEDLAPRHWFCHVRAARRMTRPPPLHPARIVSASLNRRGGRHLVSLQKDGGRQAAGVLFRHDEACRFHHGTFATFNDTAALIDRLELLIKRPTLFDRSYRGRARQKPGMGFCLARPFHWLWMAVSRTIVAPGSLRRASFAKRVFRIWPYVLHGSPTTGAPESDLTRLTPSKTGFLLREQVAARQLESVAWRPSHVAPGRRAPTSCRVFQLTRLPSHRAGRLARKGCALHARAFEIWRQRKLRCSDIACRDVARGDRLATTRRLAQPAPSRLSSARQLRSNLRASRSAERKFILSIGRQQIDIFLRIQALF